MMKLLYYALVCFSKEIRLIINKGVQNCSVHLCNSLTHSDDEVLAVQLTSRNAGSVDKWAAN